MASKTGKFNRVAHNDIPRTDNATGIVYPHRDSDLAWSEFQLAQAKAHIEAERSEKGQQRIQHTKERAAYWKAEAARLRGMTKRERYAEIGIELDENDKPIRK